MRPGACYGGPSGNGNNLVRFFLNGDKDKIVLSSAPSNYLFYLLFFA